MVRGGFRHLVVIDEGEATGVLSVRDVVRCWTDDGASCEVPQSPADGRRRNLRQLPNRQHQRIIRPPCVRGSTRWACSCAGTPGCSDEPKSAAMPSVAMTTQSPGASVVRTSLTPAATSRARRRTGSVSRRSRRARGRPAPGGPRRCRSPVQVRPAVSRSNQASVVTTPRVERSASWQRRSSVSRRLAGVAVELLGGRLGGVGGGGAVAEAVDHGDERAAARRARRPRGRRSAPRPSSAAPASPRSSAGGPRGSLTRTPRSARPTI